MDTRFPVSREELYGVQMDLKQVQLAQSSHAERILRLEKRQADDAALKSVWNSPFPGVLGGTPQHGPVRMPSHDMFEDLDEQSEHLLGSLHLGPTEEEPVRRGAASRANSVRFDESTLHAANWAGQNSRHSADFLPLRPGAGILMERSASHKSDGRHSSAGHSVHSHHSVASGRASSLGLDTNFFVGGGDSDSDDDSPVDFVEPAPSFLVMGPMPALVRCWLTTNFAHSTLLYADICTGSLKSTVEYSLIQELGLASSVHREIDGIFRAQLPVYLAEAIRKPGSSRPVSPGSPVPSIMANFEVTGVDQQQQQQSQLSPNDVGGSDCKKRIRIFIGSDTLRAHSADVLFSRNQMVAYSNDRCKLSVPFVRPEDEDIFKNAVTVNLVQGRPKLNANATPFVSSEAKSESSSAARATPESSLATKETTDSDMLHNSTPSPIQRSFDSRSVAASTHSESGAESEKAHRTAEVVGPCVVVRNNGVSSSSSSSNEVKSNGNTVADNPREVGESFSSSQRAPSNGIWSSWRQDKPSTTGVEAGSRETGGPLSGYQPASRSRNMKVLKPLKSTNSASSSSPAMTTTATPPLSSHPHHHHLVSTTPTAARSVGHNAESSQQRSVSEHRRKSQASDVSGPSSSSSSVRWDMKRNASVSDIKSPLVSREQRSATTNVLPRSANPVGGASAFAWMKSKAPTTATE